MLCPTPEAAALWSDPALWCLSLTNLTFGFAAAFLNGYVNAAFTKPQLGADFVGFFATATALTAAVMSQAWHGFGVSFFVLVICLTLDMALVWKKGTDG